MARLPVIPARPKTATTEPPRFSTPTVAPSSIAEAIAGERLRIMGILESAEATARPAAALRLALHTSMLADEAAAFLASLPAEQTAVDRLSAQFFNAMDGAADALAVAPDLASTSAFTGDRRAARLAEIAAATEAVNAANGYRPKQKA